MNREGQELKVANKQFAEWDAQLNQLDDRNGDFGLKVQMLEQEFKEVRRWGDEILKSVPTVAQFPPPADLQARRKKSAANLADIEAVVEILENH